LAKIIEFHLRLHTSKVGFTLAGPPCICLWETFYWK